jgi:threonine synthase
VLIFVRMSSFASVLGGARRYSFGDAVLAGWAEDGGMLWPTCVPQLDRGQLRRWAKLAYPELCAEFLKLFLPTDDRDISHAELDSLIGGAFSSFGSREVVKVHPLPQRLAPGARPLQVAELWHGPTLAFKDLGMSVLGRVLNHILTRRRQRMTLVVGTSGDTGSSAIEAVRGLPRIQIVVLYPLQKFSAITPVQERQMTSVAEVEPNVHVVGVEGSSDDLDVPMEACFRDAAFKTRHALGSVNSVNILRLLVQSVHFFYAYLRCDPNAASSAEFAVPCGAGGHLAAGLLAVEMGLPAKLIACTNANDAMHRALSRGELDAGLPTRKTVSPSMDIQMPYNLWRLLFVASGGDGKAVLACQERMKATGRLEIPEHVLGWIRQRVRTVAVDDEETLAIVRSAHAVSAGACLLDPHTAVGVAGAVRVRSPFGTHSMGRFTICLGCAHPVKFLPAVAAALGVGQARALELLPDSGSHCCVRAVVAMARQLQLAAGTERDTANPPGCALVLRSGEDWESRLRELISEVSRSAAAGSLTSRL